MSESQGFGQPQNNFKRKLKIREQIGKLFQSLTFLSVLIGLLALGALLVNVMTNGRLLEAMHSFVQTHQVTMSLRPATLEGDPIMFARVAKELAENTTLKKGDAIVAMMGNKVSRPGEIWEQLIEANASELAHAELHYIPNLDRLFGELKSVRTDGGRLVILEEIFPNSPASQADLLPKDVILAVAGVPVERASHVFEQILIHKLTDSNFDPIELTIKRQGDNFIIPINVVQTTVNAYEKNMFAALWFFATNFGSRYPEAAGIVSALVGSVLVILLTALIALPLGVAAAIYLEEYARKGLVSNFINVNISNLAGVPSVVYGIIGLELFARAQVLNETTGFINQLTGWQIPAIEGFGRSILSGSLTLTLLVLPIIIINAREALKAVPQSMREAAFGVGATQWQVVRHHVLPYALPGIFTGVILSISRAIGETAPLLLLGASVFVPFLPESVFSVFTVMPIQIWSWTGEPQDGMENLAAAAIFVLLFIMLLLNATAIFLRNRFQMRW